MNKIIKEIRNRWGDNPIVLRSQLVEFSCGLISNIGTLKNLEVKNPNLIKGKFRFGQKTVGYPTEEVIAFLMSRLSNESEGLQYAKK